MTGNGSSAPPPTRSRRPLALSAVAVAAVLLVALVVVLNLGGDDDAGPGASTSAGAEGAADGQPGDEPSADPSATVPSSPLPRPERRAIGTAAEPADDVSVEVTTIEAVRGQARGAGEVAGPALRVTVRVTNSTSRPLDMDLGLVNLYHGADKAPATPLSGPGAKPFPRKIRAGSSGAASFVFAVPESSRERLAVEFSYAVDVPRVVFEGSVDDV